MATALSYAIKYVADMDRAIQFYRDNLGFALRFESPYWSEFDTGATTLALHPATREHPAGSCQLGFRVPDFDAFHAEMLRREVKFSAPPAPMHGQKIARFIDCEGAECSVSGT